MPSISSVARLGDKRELYLVTGGAGFIGSHLVEALVGRGSNVRVFDNLSTGKLENIRPWQNQIEFIKGDIRDSACLHRALDGVTFVLHQAALPSVQRSYANPLESHKVNTFGTLRLLLAAKEAGVRRFVYASSSSVYGDSMQLPRQEDMPTAPSSVYAVGKLAAENYCRVFYKLYGLETVCLRYFNVFGPRQDVFSPYAAVIPTFIRAIKSKAKIVVYGDGQQSRDFTFVTNVVSANLLACQTGGIAGEVFNVGCGQSTTLMQLIRCLEVLFDTVAHIEFEQARPGDVRHSQASIEKARRLLHYSPIVSLEEGLRMTADSLQMESSVRSGDARAKTVQ